MLAASPNPREVIGELNALASGATSAQELMEGITKLLHQKMLCYNWVGFYMLEEEGAQDMLVLGPFRGTMTGICGAAASTAKTIVIDDVSADPRYLACSLETKSEIVVPVFVEKRVVGELDIDSHFLAAFTPDDRSICEHAAAVLGRWLEKHP
jgi:L-methionine (R)-S-oxide reductase